MTGWEWFQAGFYFSCGFLLVTGLTVCVLGLFAAFVTRNNDNRF